MIYSVNKRAFGFRLYCSVCICISATCSIVLAQEALEVKQAIQEHTLLKKLGPDYTAFIPFMFDKKPLREIINRVTAARGVNILLPQNPVQFALINKQLVSYTPPKGQRISLTKAWRLTQLFLDLIGFSVIKKETHLYAIVPNGKPGEASVTREPLPLFVNTPPSKLPKGTETIRYVYYLRNLTVPAPSEAASHPITQIANELLSPSAAPILYDQKTNGLLLVDKAENITSAMHIITELDATGFKETVEVLPLYNLPARDVKNVFETLRKAAGGETAPTVRPAMRQDPQADTIAYFAADTKLVTDERTNSLILMGRETAVARLSEFIQEYIDTPPQSGKSILHTYDLQYLDAPSFAKILQDIVSAQAASQSQSAPSAGPYRFFNGVQIVAEQQQQLITEERTPEVLLEQAQGIESITGIQGKTLVGGNRLIIAALHDDWIHIEQLIKQLDKPQLQVILEMLLVDVSFDQEQLIAGTIRNPLDMPFDICDKNQGVNFLASHISPPNTVLGIPPQLTAPPPTLTTVPPTFSLARDLLGFPGNDTTPSVISVVNDKIGSTLISFNDPQTPGIAALLQLFSRSTQAKILSNPYLVTLNNQKGVIEIVEERRVVGNSFLSRSGFTLPQLNLPAAIKLAALPRLNSDDRLTLEIGIQVDQFVSASDPTRITRLLKTKVNLATGQVVALGGLIRSDTIDNETDTPLLSRIPILGAFFQRRNKFKIQRHLTLFIAPIIIMPRNDKKTAAYTKHKLRDFQHKAGNPYLDYNDPITRLFFPQTTGQETIKEYLYHTTNLTQLPQELQQAYAFKALVKDPEKRATQLKQLLATEELSIET